MSLCDRVEYISKDNQPKFANSSPTTVIFQPHRRSSGSPASSEQEPRARSADAMPCGVKRTSLSSIGSGIISDTLHRAFLAAIESRLQTGGERW